MVCAVTLLDNAVMIMNAADPVAFGKPQKVGGVAIRVGRAGIQCWTSPSGGKLGYNTAVVVVVVRPAHPLCHETTSALDHIWTTLWLVDHFQPGDPARCFRNCSGSQVFPSGGAVSLPYSIDLLFAEGHKYNDLIVYVLSPSTIISSFVLQ